MIGLLSTGFIADYIGIGLTFVILGSIIALIGIVSFFVPVLMRLGIPEPYARPNVESPDYSSQ
jgi:DHA3 family macrolide efflux protein-like MFS transporter